MSQAIEVDLPVANLRPLRARSWSWLIPLLALVAVFWIGERAWQERGPTVWLHAQHGQGIKAGGLVRYRGIAVGEVISVELTGNLNSVLMEVRLEPGAEAIARVGSRFWVVRPDISLDRLRGLDTILGARHLAVLPGLADARQQNEFICLEEEPVLFPEGGRGVEFILEAPRRLGLAPGAPITYRDMEIGSVLSVSLSSDSTLVEIHAVVRPSYVQLVREDSRFWQTSGLEFSAGLVGGVKLNLKSLRSLIVGGIAVATPTQPGALIRTGHRFSLVSKAQEEWLDWQPALPLGGRLLPAGTPRVDLQRARAVWEEGLFGRNKQASAWLLPMQGYVLGPADVLAPGKKADDPTLEVRGQSVALDTPAEAQVAGVARRAISWNDLPMWPSSRVRALGEPEDVIVVVNSNRAPMAVDAPRLSALEGEQAHAGWRVDPAIPFDENWHGAAVLARRDGHLIGLLLVDSEGVTVRPIMELLTE